jgi:hypothetical protein
VIRLSNLLAGLFAASALVPALAMAQEKKDPVIETFKSVGGNQDIFAYDFGVPQSPAMLLLGLQGGSVAPASTLKALVGQIGNVIGGSGQSFALEITPAALLGGGKDLVRYARDGNGGYLYRLVRRSHIGVAGILGSTGSTPVQSGVSLGLTVALLDGSDPWRAKSVSGGDLKTCILDQSRAIVPLFDEATKGGLALPADQSMFGRLGTLENRIVDSLDGTTALPTADFLTVDDKQLLRLAGIDVVDNDMKTDPATTLRKVNIDITARRRKIQTATFADYLDNPLVIGAQREITNCAKSASNAAAFGSDLTIGGGTFWRGKPGEFSQMRNGGGAVWAAFRTGVATEWQGEAGSSEPSAVWLIAASSRYGIGESIATGDAAIANIRADTLDGWVGIERRQPDFLMSARLGYQQVRATDATGRFFNRQGSRFLLNAQKRVTDQMWLSVSYGNAGGSVDTYNAKRFLVSVAFSPPKPDNIITKD